MMFAPAGTPRKIVDRLNEAVNAGLQQPDIRQRLKDLGAEVMGGTPEQAADFLKRNLARWTESNRVLRRLQSLRKWSHYEQADQVFPRSP